MPSFRNILGSSLRAALKNPGNMSATLNTFRELQAKEARSEEWRKTLGAWAVLHAYITQKLRETAVSMKSRRANGENVRIETLVFFHDFGNYKALIKMFENGDAHRVDVFYGGPGVPDNDPHGHIVLRDMQAVFWRHVDGTVYVNK